MELFREGKLGKIMEHVIRLDEEGGGIDGGFGGGRIFRG